MNAVKLHESGGECSEKTFYRLVAVKLHNFTAELSSEIKLIHRFEKSEQII